jgi:hypothetical protein
MTQRMINEGVTGLGVLAFMMKLNDLIKEERILLVGILQSCWPHTKETLTEENQSKTLTQQQKITEGSGVVSRMTIWIEQGVSLCHMAQWSHTILSRFGCPFMISYLIVAVVSEMIRQHRR